MAHVLSENAKLYRNAGTYGSPTWTEIPNVKDLTLGMDKGDVDITTRASGGFVERVDGLIDATIDFQMLWDTADANFTAMQTAYFAKTAIEFLVLDGVDTASGSQGLRATCMIKTFTRTETLGEALMVDVQVLPTAAANAPAWYTATTTTTTTTLP